MSDIKKIFAQVAKNVRPIRKKFCSARKKKFKEQWCQHCLLHKSKQKCQYSNELNSRALGKNPIKMAIADS